MKALRASSLATLAKCPGLHMLQSSSTGPASTQAADTGSAAGRACQLYHEGYDLEGALRKIEGEAAERFPQADLSLAQRLARAYMQDERNHPHTIAGHCELEVRLDLDPDPDDPVREVIRLAGHVDQLRRDPSGRLRVWDLKAGSPPGLDLLYSHAWQLAAYAVAATATLGEPVLPGGVIRLRGYEPKAVAGRPSEANVFFAAPWSLEDCHVMLASVRSHVAMLRAGRVHLHPGAHCSWCPAAGPNLCASRVDALAQLAVP